MSGKRVGGKWSKSRSLHSDQSTDKHARDKEYNKHQMQTRLLSGEFKATGALSGHPLLEEGDLDHNIFYQGFVPGKGIVSTIEAREAIDKAVKDLEGLPVRNGTVAKHRAALSRTKEGTRELNHEDCVQYEMNTFSPAVSAWWAQASPEHRMTFLSEMMPKISEWSERRYEGSTNVGLQLHCDTSHLHFDSWQRVGQEVDFKGRKIKKGFLYNPKAMCNHGVGMGICHLARKKEAYDLAGLELSKREADILAKGLSQGERQGRMKDLNFQRELDSMCADVIRTHGLGMDSLESYARAYAEADFEASPYRSLESLTLKREESRRLSDTNQEKGERNYQLERDNQKLQEELIDKGARVKQIIKMEQEVIDSLKAKRAELKKLDPVLEEIRAFIDKNAPMVQNATNQMFSLIFFDDDELKPLILKKLEDENWRKKYNISDLQLKVFLRKLGVKSKDAPSIEDRSI